MIKAEVKTIAKDPQMGPFYGVEIGGFTYPIPYREGDIRKIEPGVEIECMTSRDGTVTIVKPEPQIGCKKE